MTGRPGRNAVSRVVMGHKIVLELAPIPHQNMAATSAVEKAKKSVHAVTSHAQVNSFQLFINCQSLFNYKIRFFADEASLSRFS